MRTLAEGISHEFNNLLTGILGYAELLSVRLDHDQLGGDYADRIVRAATEARELTRQISVLSGGALLEFCEFDFQQVLEGALQAAHALSAPEIRFLKRSPTVAVRAQGDAEHLQQAIVALLQNACEAMPGGGALTTELEAVVLDKPLAKELGLVRGGPYLRLTIIDEGIGMDASTRRNACEPFFTTKSAPHAGLGLCRALGIIQKHHGTIQIDSEPSHGTSVRIFLPASPRDTRSSAVVIAPSADHATTVLLVEDEEIPRELQAHVLQSAGYAVLAAVDGRQGLELFREYGTQIQLVITDVMMPRMTGDLMVAEMRRLGATVPVMAISGYSRGEAIERLRTLGVDAFVQKPFTGDRLLEQVRQLLAPRAEG